MVLRTVVVHDYLTQRGGAERVVLAMLRALPGARLVTSVYDPDGTYPEFREHEVETLWPDRVGLFRDDPRRALPVLAHAFSRHRIDDADVVLCSSSGWAHGVTTSARKVVYCYTPARWLWRPGDYLRDAGAVPRAAVRILGPSLRRWDVRAARTAARYLTLSTVVRDRIRDAYGIEAAVVPPPVTLDPAGPREPVPGVEPGYFLAVGRRRGYKNIDLLYDAFAGLPGHRLVAAGDTPLTDAQMRWLYANAVATVAVAFEDFGLTPLEGNAFGRPALALRAGGFLDTVSPGVNGDFVAAPSVDAIRAAVTRFDPAAYDPAVIDRHLARYSYERFATDLRQVLGIAV